MKKRSKPVPALSKYGLPKNTITSAYSAGVPERARHWAETRNEVEALLLDIEDAFEEGILSPQQYRAERAQMSFQLRRSIQEYDKALRQTGPKKK